MNSNPLYRPNKKRFDYTMNGEILETVKHHPYLGVELSDNVVRAVTGEFRRVPEMYDNCEMCSPLYLHGLHELLFPPIMTSWSPPWSMVRSYLPTICEYS